jgi:hypothetical protein
VVSFITTCPRYAAAWLGQNQIERLGRKGAVVDILSRRTSIKKLSSLKIK